MSKVDWSLAPEGATHYNQNNEMFYLLKGGIYHFYASDDVELIVGGPPSDYELSSFVERPQPKPWSGPEDGLPPVGTECLFDICGKLFKVKIFAHRHEPRKAPCALFDMIENSEWGFGDACRFKRIRTTEQLRETAIREVMDIAQVDCRVTAARLVDAGFKR